MALRKNWKESRDIFLEIRQSLPTFPDAWINLGNAYVELQQFASAINCVRTCIFHISALILLVRALLEQIRQPKKVRNRKLHLEGPLHEGETRKNDRAATCRCQLIERSQCRSLSRICLYLLTHRFWKNHQTILFWSITTLFVNRRWALCCSRTTNSKEPSMIWRCRLICWQSLPSEFREQLSVHF